MPSSVPPGADSRPKPDLEATAQAAIGAAYEVANVLGPGLLEKLYERALIKELTLCGLAVKSQVPYPVFYKGERLGTYQADLVVENQLILELKCVERFTNEHLAQVINYLSLSNHRLALLLNFQRRKVEWKRVIFG